jgi:uncharacterized membrane protein (UPF0127 family)
MNKMIKVGILFMSVCIRGLLAQKTECSEDQPASPVKPLSTMSINMGNTKVTAWIADEDASRYKGLLGRETIDEDRGMLLDFLREGLYAIHMETMKFPIDAVWMDSKGVIKLIYEDIQPNSGQIYPSMFPCRYCLELKSGFCRKNNVKIGQEVRLGQN